MKIGITEKGTQIDVTLAQKQEKYFCPQCHGELKICDGRYKKKYFAHRFSRKNPRRNQKGESKRHLMGKRRITDFFIERGILVQTEYYLPDIKRRADLKIEINGQIYLIEYQCSPIDLEVIQKRTKAYLKLGLPSYWIAGPNHFKNGSLFQTVQKFGRYSKREGWWILTWDALKQSAPRVIFNIHRGALGKIVYQERSFEWDKSGRYFMNLQFSQLPSLEYEARGIEQHLLGNQVDQRYLQAQQLCYSNGKNLMGCPWEVHFPRVCTDFKNQGIPLLNRVRFIVEVEQKAEISMDDVAQIDIEFWNMLQEKHMVANKAGKWVLISENIRWYDSLSEKMAQKNQSRMGKL